MFIACNSSEEYRGHLRTDKLVVLSFWARCSRPCTLLQPRLQEVSAPNAVLLNINVDEHEDIQHEWRVRVLPTFVLIRNREEVARLEGDSIDALTQLLTAAHTSTCP